MTGFVAQWQRLCDAAQTQGGRFDPMDASG